MKQRIIVGGWSRHLATYGDTRDPDDIIPKYWGAGAHKDDILCMAYQEPNTLASASYDGDLIIWNLDVERSACRLNAKKANQSSHSVGEKGASSSSLTSTRSRDDRRRKHDRRKDSNSSTKDENAIEKV